MSTKAQINAAMKLLKNEGYTVNKKRPDPRIGDVVRFNCDSEGPYDVLITFHQTTPANNMDCWDYGGMEIIERPYDNMNTEACWIDRNEWAKDDGQYEVIGHVDLTKWIKR